MSGNKGKQPTRFHRKEVQKMMVKNARKAKIIDKIVSIFAILCVILAVIPLSSILFEVIKDGIAAI